MSTTTLLDLAVDETPHSVLDSRLGFGLLSRPLVDATDPTT